MGPAPAAYTAFASRFSFSLLEKPRPRLRKLAEPPADTAGVFLQRQELCG